MAEGKRLQGKVAIITGASSGLGRAIAVTLAENGAKVALAARRMEKLQEVEKAISAGGGVAISVKVDVVNKEDIRELVCQTERTLGPVDILVNNAGTFYITMMKNAHLEEWDNMIDVNIKGLTNCIGVVLPKMVERGQGHIINMSSENGRRGFPGMAVYTGTKYYVEGLSRSLRHEVADSNIRVTCIQPGDTQTDIFSFTTDKEWVLLGMSGNLYSHETESVPLAQEKYYNTNTYKMLEASDIANAVLYAVTQPDYAAVNEILIQPRAAPI